VFFLRSRILQATSGRQDRSAMKSIEDYILG